MKFCSKTRSLAFRILNVPLNDDIRYMYNLTTIKST